MVARGFEETARNMARIENNLIYQIGSVKDQLVSICAKDACEYRK